MCITLQPFPCSVSVPSLSRHASVCSVYQGIYYRALYYQTRTDIKSSLAYEMSVFGSSRRVSCGWLQTACSRRPLELKLHFWEWCHRSAGFGTLRYGKLLAAVMPIYPNNSHRCFSTCTNWHQQPRIASDQAAMKRRITDDTSHVMFNTLHTLIFCFQLQNKFACACKVWFFLKRLINSVNQ